MDSLERLLQLATKTTGAMIYIYARGGRIKETPQQPNYIACFPGPISADTANLVQRAAALGEWVVILAQQTNKKQTPLMAVDVRPFQSANAEEPQPTNDN